MKRPSEQDQRRQLRNKIIGLGERSIRKSYYPELQQRIAELEEINKELREEIAIRRQAEKTKEKLEEQLRQAMKMEAIGTLAGGVAHDFNNILTAIIGYTDLARMHLDSECSEKKCPITLDLERLHEAGYRARDLVRQLLTFSRQHKQEKTPVLLGEVVAEALKLLRASLPRSIEITENLGEERNPVLADATQIHQIVMNLCTNSSHAMVNEAGTIGVSVYTTEIRLGDNLGGDLDTTPGIYSVLEVSDNGKGMNREVLERVFDPYFTTKADRGGTGMGLAVVHGIVKEHRGYINAYSETGRGTTFRVYFPQVNTGSAAKVIPSEDSLPVGREKILLVDDEEVVLELETQLLERLGYTVTACNSPLDALQILKENKYHFDLIMTDMTMPKKNGVELTRDILKKNPDIPVVICTGFSELVDEDRAKAIGARTFVMKPLILKEIAETLREILDADESSGK